MTSGVPVVNGVTLAFLTRRAWAWAIRPTNILQLEVEVDVSRATRAILSKLMRDHRVTLKKRPRILQSTDVAVDAIPMWTNGGSRQTSRGVSSARGRTAR